MTILDSVEKFDPNTRNWTSVASTLAPRTGHALVKLNDGRVAVIGGASLGETSVGGGMAPENVPDVELYTPQSGRGLGFLRCAKRMEPLRRCRQTTEEFWHSV